MPIRVGIKTRYDQILYNLNNLTENIRKLQNQLASGTKFEKPSDNPVDLVRSLDYRRSLSEIKRYQVSIREGKSFLRTMEGAYQGLEDIAIRAKELALQAGNDIMNAENRKAIAQEVDNLLKEALALANTRHGNRYVFGGNRPTNYKNGEKPFELIKENIQSDDILERVIYHGGEEDLKYSYAPEGKIIIGQNGNESIIKSGIFDTLISLKKTLENNNISDSHKEIEDIKIHIDRLEKVFNYLSTKRAELGTKMDHLELKENLYNNLKDTIKENLSDTQDVDFLEVITRLKSKEIAYQAALSASSKVMQLSLVNFLS